MLRLTENGSIRRLVRDRIDSLARPLVEMGATTNAVRWFVWSNGKLLSQVESNGTVRVAHSDELGKVLALTDNSGVLTDEFAYQLYGRLIAHSGTTDVSFAYMGDYGVWHAGQGLYLTRHRAYDANLARFLQTDPIGLVGGYNLYLFGEGAPSIYIDSLGLWAGIDDAIFAGGGALIGLAGQGISDLIAGQTSPMENYIGSATAGAAGGAILLYTGNPVLAGAGGAALGNVVKQAGRNSASYIQTGEFAGVSPSEFLTDVGVGTITGFIPGPRISGITAGQGSALAVSRQMTTKFAQGQIQNVTTPTASKMFIGQAAMNMLPGTTVGSVASGVMQWK